MLHLPSTATSIPITHAKMLQMTFYSVFCPLKKPFFGLVVGRVEFCIFQFHCFHFSSYKNTLVSYIDYIFRSSDYMFVYFSFFKEFNSNCMTSFNFGKSSLYWQFLTNCDSRSSLCMILGATLNANLLSTMFFRFHN